MKKRLFTFLLVIAGLAGISQPVNFNHQAIAFEKASLPEGEIAIGRLQWLPGSHEFWVSDKGNLVVYNAADLAHPAQVLSAAQVKASGLTTATEAIVWSSDRKKILIYTNAARVWRGRTRGDYWYFDLSSGKGRQIGRGLPASSLMFAKFSPDNKMVAYVSRHNLYTENLVTGAITQLTRDGTDRIINGTFDWVYEEELSCRDGFRWCPDSKSIAFWRVDATGIRNHLMINNTDSLYPFVIPVEYPKAGEKPSSVKIGVVNIMSKNTKWLRIPGDPQNNYLPRMEWAGNDKEIMVVQLNRHQNEASLYLCSAITGQATKIYTDKDSAWVDVVKPFVWDQPSWTWVDNGRSFLWTSEKDGWMHIYKVSRDGKQEQLLTKGNFDADMVACDANGNIYFIASPYDATQKYLYRVGLAGTDTVRVTPAKFDGTNFYRLSPDAQFAAQVNGSIHRNYSIRLVSLPDHKKVYPAAEDTFTAPDLGFTLEKFSIKTADGISMDGIMAKPTNFDSAKKYPVYFYVYGEPASTTADDLPVFDQFIAQLIPEGYIGITLDNRGTPALKGREWRKSIYKKIGILNSHDQAMAAREILKWPFIDTSRVAVHGWSGGGAMTLNLLFRYPGIYKTGIAIAAVTDQHFYDNVYTERYMGLPAEDPEAYMQASPVTFAANLQGNLLYIHGTGDDNVHYKNAEVLINELVKHGKLFQFMAYPNRTHGISEGEGTSQHLNTTFIRFLRQYCPPGAH
ncbi:MAG TPA: DPP IV N-terminal domain-containing protein [Chitinophagaceae bacterium]|nr:DPP IV N-terminal domain-containing protein [Chitinophagaceae bacterium]